MNNFETMLADYQLSSEEAIEYGTSRRWEALTPSERGVLQLRQERLCMPFDVFHEGITELLGRPVFTHEFARPDLLWREYLCIDDAPDFQAIIAKMPEHLRPCFGE